MLISGTVLDRDGDVLSSVENGHRTYYENETVRKATLHAVGDLYGKIGTGVLNAFADKLTGFDLVNGAFGAEITLRVFVNNEKPYWYVGLVRGEHKVVALLIDGVTGDVLAIRELY